VSTPDGCGLRVEQVHFALKLRNDALNVPERVIGVNPYIDAMKLVAGLPSVLRRNIDRIYDVIVILTEVEAEYYQ
jgi:hypothetical protein